MPAGVVIPFRFVPDTLADADQVNANFDALQAKFNAGIVDGDVSPSADLDGNKLSQNPLKQVPETRLGTSSVSQRVLQKDANSPGSDALRAVTGDHIALLTVAQVLRFMPAGAITSSMLAAGAALANLAAASVGLNKLKITLATAAFGPLNPGANATVASGFLAIAAFPTATFDVLAAYTTPSVADVAHGVSVIANGANHGVRVWAHGDSGGDSISGTAVVVFISKT